MEQLLKAYVIKIMILKNWDIKNFLISQILKYLKIIFKYNKSIFYIYKNFLF